MTGFCSSNPLDEIQAVLAHRKPLSFRTAKGPARNLLSACTTEARLEAAPFTPTAAPLPAADQHRRDPATTVHALVQKDSCGKGREASTVAQGNVRYRTLAPFACENIVGRIHFCVPALLLRSGTPMVGNSDFQVTCRICHEPLQLGIDTAADEDGKAVHESCYVRKITDVSPDPPATPATD